MRNRFLSILALVAISGVLLTSCGDDKKEVQPKTQPSGSDKNLSGTITNELTLDASKEYFLTGALLVEKGGTLKIPAGTTIKARKGFNNYILVLQGGKIYINGTKDKPVTMTADTDKAEEGHWGGLIVNGYATLTKGKDGKYSIGKTEISNANSYGGENDADNSGVIEYLKIMYPGARSSGDVEHNGLTLNGVGNKTKIENVYVYNSADDGIEFFGGSVNVKNLLVVNSDDDMFDVTQGWTGTLDNCYGIWEKGFTSSEDDPRGVEADGNLDGKLADHTMQSDFTIKNMTIDLQLAPSEAKETHMHDVLKIRRGAKATILNALVKGQGKAKDLIDFGDRRGDGDYTSKIEITNALTNAKAIFGKQIEHRSKNKDQKFPNVNITKTGNKGADKSVFGWTGYKFK